MARPNTFPTARVKGLGNREIDAATERLLDAADSSGIDDAVALAAGFRTGMISRMDCDQLFTVAKLMPDKARQAVYDDLTLIRTALRDNADFGKAMGDFKVTDQDMRFTHAKGLLANMDAQGVPIGRVTAQVAASNAPTVEAAKGLLNDLSKQGVMTNDDTKVGLSWKAIDAGDFDTAATLISNVDEATLSGRSPSVLKAIRARLAGSKADAAE